MPSAAEPELSELLAGAAVHNVHGDGVKRRAFDRPELGVLDRAAVKTRLFNALFRQMCLSRARLGEMILST